MRLMKRIRDSIDNNCFPVFVRKFVRNYYSNQKNLKKSECSKLDYLPADEEANASGTKNNKIIYPDWIVNSLKSVNIDLLEDVGVE